MVPVKYKKIFSVEAIVAVDGFISQYFFHV